MAAGLSKMARAKGKALHLGLDLAGGFGNSKRVCGASSLGIMKGCWHQQQRPGDKGEDLHLGVGLEGGFGDSKLVGKATFLGCLLGCFLCVPHKAHLLPQPCISAGLPCSLDHLRSKTCKPNDLF